MPLLRSDETKFSEGLILKKLGSTDFWFGFIFFSPGASLITMSGGYASCYFRKVCFSLIAEQ